LLGANNRIVADPSDPNWGSWIGSGLIDMKRKQAEVFTLPNEIDRDKKEFSMAVEFLRDNPGKIPVLLIGKMYRLFNPSPMSANKLFVAIVALSGIFLLPTSLAGIYMVLRDRQRRILFIPIFAQLLTLLATALIYYGSERFRAPYEPLFAIFAAIVLYKTAGSISRKLQQWRIVRAGS